MKHRYLGRDDDDFLHRAALNIVMLAPFAYAPKATVSARMLPMAAALARRGHAATILIPPYDYPADSGRAWSRQGVRVENMRLARSPISVLQYLCLARQLARRARELNPDIIHVFKPVGPGALAMQLLHPSSFILHPSYVVDNDDWEGASGWIDVNPYPAVQKQFMAWQERWCLRHAAAVTCASDALVERTLALTQHAQSPRAWLATPHSSPPTLLLPNGPDDNLRAIVADAEQRRRELREKLGWSSHRVLIYAGTVPIGHDLDVAAQAIRRILDSDASAHDLRWVVVATGDGLPSFRSAIQKFGLERMVSLQGFMPHERLIEYLVAADIALYPYRDTPINRAKCSGKVIDYMACAKPMVVSDVGMNRVYLQDGISGWLTPPGDAEAFAAALQKSLADPPSADRMGRAAQTRLWECFGWESRIETLETCYRALIRR